jgi:hypothetical protein
MADLATLQHALGVDEFGRGRQFRNHFCTGPGSDDFDACLANVAEGLMVRKPGSELTGGDDLFLVTDAGKQFVAGNSPPPPTRTRSQAHYEAYLDADSCLSFGEWMRRRRVRDAAADPVADDAAQWTSQ